MSRIPTAAFAAPGLLARLLPRLSRRPANDALHVRAVRVCELSELAALDAWQQTQLTWSK
jgi:hypothetical protein